MASRFRGGERSNVRQSRDGAKLSYTKLAFPLNTRPSRTGTDNFIKETNRRYA